MPSSGHIVRSHLTRPPQPHPILKCAVRGRRAYTARRPSTQGTAAPNLPCYARSVQVLSTPDPNVTVMRPCTVFPIEFIVRGYLTGSTETSLWTHYKSGERSYCGNVLPDGMRKNARLQQHMITPTTKSVDRDVPITPDEIVAQVRLARVAHVECALACVLCPLR